MVDKGMVRICLCFEGLAGSRHIVQSRKGFLYMIYFQNEYSIPLFVLDIMFVFIVTCLSVCKLIEL